MTEDGHPINVEGNTSENRMVVSFEDYQQMKQQMADMYQAWISGAQRSTLGAIDLCLTVGPVDFMVEFQVIDMSTTYNMLLGRPWIHMAGAVPSTLHQNLKFEWNRQEIIIHGEGDLSIYNDKTIPVIESQPNGEFVSFQAVEVASVIRFAEGEPLGGPALSAAAN